MTWKLFLTAFASLALLLFPQNLIGCADPPSPYDYYTAFFSQKLNPDKTYEPFYYSSLLQFYDADDEKEASIKKDKVLLEWKKYVQDKASLEEAGEFVYGYSAAQVWELYQKSLSGLSIPAKTNKMGAWLVTQKKTDALQYLVFAKEVEMLLKPSTEWEEVHPDSLQANSHLIQAKKYSDAAKDLFFKSKYAFLLCKLAFYNKRYKDCIRWYDQYFLKASDYAVKQLALAYKGGSLFRLNRKAEAAYAFTQAFNFSDYRRKINFLGFSWSLEYDAEQLPDEFLRLCKSKKEQAEMTGMFALRSPAYQLANLRKIYSLYPSSPLLEVLCIREVKKLEEHYLTPVLGKENGGKIYYSGWYVDMEKSVEEDRKQLELTLKFIEGLAKTPERDKSLLLTMAAYLNFMKRDYARAGSLTQQVLSLKPSQKINDQVQLINLLIIANSANTIGPELERTILPALKWLKGKALKDNEYSLFFRNFFSEILAQKYEQQKNGPRTAMVYGVADMNFDDRYDGYHSYWYSGYGLEYIREQMNTGQLLQLYQLWKNEQTRYESFLLQNLSFTPDDLLDMIGTSYLRDRNYEKAMEWLNRSKNPVKLYTINYSRGNVDTVLADPFYSYTNDWERYDQSAKTPYTKLKLARELLDLKKKINNEKNNEGKARLYFKMATALYNMSRYGNSSQAIVHYYSSTSWYDGSYELNWEKEFYGVFEARRYFEKAFEVSRDKEFRAQCFFQIIKCAQRQIPIGGHSNETENKAAEGQFLKSPLFPKYQKEFGDTKYFKYTDDRCSYLRDFLK